MYSWAVIELGTQISIAVVCKGKLHSVNCGYHLTLANPEKKRKMKQLFEN